METNRSLLNPKFEGYRLDLIPQEKAVRRYDLQYRATQATTSARALLSFQDVQSRITHNHLCVSSQGDCALYVDADYNVVVIEVDLAEFTPEFRVVYELPKPVYSAASAGDRDLPQYPSAAFLGARTVFVTDGHGDMYVLEIPDGKQPARLLGQYKLRQSSLPFRIHNAVPVSERAVVLLSSKAPDPDESPTPKRRSPEYDVWAVQFSLPFNVAVEAVQVVRDLDVLWQRRGDDVPIYTAFDDSRQTFLLIGSSLYHEIGAPPLPSYEPSPDEMAPIPREDENFDIKPLDPPKPPPYSWTQTSDSVTVAFPLPSKTPKTDIKVTFSPRTLTLHVQGEAASTALPLPYYSLKQFWDGILPSTSFWTWDREAEHAYGLLTLHLDKQHEGTRWMHVFAASGTAATPDDVEVPETLDPSELGAIRESLEKYTSSLREGGGGADVSGLGLGGGVPSLAEGEMDDEVDASVGRDVYLTPVGQQDPVAAPSDAPFVLLSTPLPGNLPASVSLVVKTGLDGPLFSMDDGAKGAPPPPAGATGGGGGGNATKVQWSHTATYSALAFVLASKRDTRFTHHVGAKTVLAFESGAGGRGANVYVYRGARVSEKWAKQAVLKTCDAAAGSLLGVGALKVTQQRKQLILCLTEKQLVLLHDVIS